MGKLMIAIIAVIILAIPFIIVYQLSKADINIEDLTFPINDPFRNQCFFGQSECRYTTSLSIGFQDQMELNRWIVTGEDVWCIKIEMSVAEPVSDPVGVITERSEFECNNIAIFDKDDWNLAILQAELIDGGESQTYIFTMKEGI